MAKKMILRKKYGSPALANLRGTERPRLARIHTTAPKQVRIATTTPTYRGSFSVSKKK